MRGTKKRAPIIAIFAIAALFAAIPVRSAAQDGELRHFDLRIENGRLTDNRSVIKVARGDAVELRWTADKTALVHLHGYDIEIRVAAGNRATMSFRANATGRFAIETHAGNGTRVKGRHSALVYLEVHPR